MTDYPRRFFGVVNDCEEISAEEYEPALGEKRKNMCDFDSILI